MTVQTTQSIRKMVPAKDLGSPFDLGNGTGYKQWRAAKLAAYPETAEDLIVGIDDLTDPGPCAIHAISERCRAANMAVYRLPAHSAPVTKAILKKFASRFGLTRLHRNMLADGDGITSLAYADKGPQQAYIPYSNRAIDWHTDGYYNTADEQVRAMVLHCAGPSAEGGVSGLLDHEIAYIRLRDHDPELVRASMHPEAMTIPANTAGKTQIRPARTGPVFSVNPSDGSLHMRYTARPTHVVWRDDAATAEAVRFLRDLLAGGEPLIFRYRLRSGEGVICNNVLHDRTAFEDDATSRRLLYRARFLDRISTI